jgi:hypothetical protein
MTTDHKLLPGDRKAPPAALTEWLNPIDWRTFGTFEFPWNARPETARLKFDEMINNLERDMRTRVCFVLSAETRAKSGAPVPLHFHAAMTAAKPISTRLVTDVWNAGAGRTSSTSSDLALVEPYDPTKDGLRYIFKQITEQDCEWDFRNVHLFNPNVKLDSKLDHAFLRSTRRWQQEISQAAA